MFEKVNPSHPDKIADRIAGAITDYAYSVEKRPKLATEVLIGHGTCTIICESSVDIPKEVVENIVFRISEDNTIKVELVVVPQDKFLSKNQEIEIKCGDNGIFKGVPTTDEQLNLSCLVKELYKEYPSDGKYILSNDQLVCCQSKINSNLLLKELKSKYNYNICVNPLGDWSGGINVDSGATNRKLGSDMGDSVTGGGLHGKDLSKADVSINIYAYLKAQLTKKEVKICCAIGDNFIDGLPYFKIVEIAKTYIDTIGGFEKFAEWGLI